MPTLNGTVKDSAGNFVQRLVRAYRRDTGEIVGQTLSDATTGAFSITVATSAEHFVIAHDGVVTQFDTNWPSVVLAMHFNGANGSTSFIDEKGHTVTAYGNAALTTTDPKFGTACLALDGSEDYARIDSADDLNLGTGDFTVEAFINMASMPTSDAWPSDWSSHQVVVSKGISGGAPGYNLTIGATKILWNSNDAALAKGDHGITTGTWFHVAATRQSGTLRTFVGGVKRGETAGVTTDYTYVSPFCIGCETTDGSWLNGKIDGLRITKGVARYTADFTPPALAFPNSSDLAGGAGNAVVYDRLIPV